MTARFNPPPNWPAPPADWSPPKGWKPDPAWGPAPDGWALWLDEDGSPARRFTDGQLAQIARAREVLQDGEQVLDVTTGMIEVRRLGSPTKRNGAVIVRDRRVILYTKKIGGYEMNDHVYGLLTALDYKKGVVFGNLTLAAAGDRTHISQVPKDDVERVSKCIRMQMAATQHHTRSMPTGTVSPAHSTADEIRKLAALRDEGILTEQEFAAKKQQLLDL